MQISSIGGHALDEYMYDLLQQQGVTVPSALHAAVGSTPLHPTFKRYHELVRGCCGRVTKRGGVGGEVVH